MRRTTWHINRMKYFGKWATLKCVKDLLDKTQRLFERQQRAVLALNELVDRQYCALQSRTKRISELQGNIDSLKRQNKELQANLLAKDGIIKKQTIMLEEAKPKEAKYIKSGNQYFCSNCNADFQHYELYDKD